MDWNMLFRRYMAVRDPRWGPLLDAIESLCGNPVTAQDEAGWEQQLALLLLNIEKYKYQLTCSWARTQPDRRPTP